MTATRSEPAAPGLLGQLTRFVAVGVVSALVDFGVYQLLLSFGANPSVAKSISFVLGTTTAYVLNRRFTFTEAGGGRGRFAAFVALYAATFVVNVGVNALSLALLPDVALLSHAALRTSVAWVIAQGCATAINFVLLRTVVFRSPSHR